MLFIEIETLEFPVGYIKIMLFIEIEKLELAVGFIEIILFIAIKTLAFDSKDAILKLCYL